MTKFFDRLTERMLKVDSLLCIGIDPHPADLKDDSPQTLRDFSLRLIESTSHLAAAYKPNAAFYEAAGPEGWAILKESIAAVPDGIPVLLDAKRGDISSTAEAYALSALQKLGADAVTLNAYLGYDSLAPFLNMPGKAAFLLCKTSNPGAKDFQDLELGGADAGLKLYEKVALQAAEWHKLTGNIGLVVGATHVDALSRLRDLVPETWFLTPGLGAQGGDLVGSMRAGLRKDGLGLLVPVSRGIARAADPGAAADDFRRQINQVRASLRDN